MDDVCFTSVCFGDRRYVDQQVRLKESILKIYPQANLNFYFDRIPRTSKSFWQSLYGFKPHAIQETRLMGFNKVIWLDPAMILCDKVDDFFKYNVIAVKDDNRLFDLMSDRCVSEYGLSRDKMKEDDWRLVGGSLYYFDFNFAVARDVFNHWFTSEQRGLFGSQQEAATEQINGHRNDETCMAVAMYQNGLEPQPGPDVRYCIEKNPIFIKRHFK